MGQTRALVFILWSANISNLDKSKSMSFDKELSLYHTIPTFNDPEAEVFENIVGKAENVNVTSILSFSHISILSNENFNF